MPTNIDFAGLTAKQQATWARGDFNVVALQVIGASDALVTAIDPRPNQRVLDVACGSGNAALAAARRYCKVSGIDYVPALIERAKLRATAEGTTIDFQVADAQALPFADAAFDSVLSVFGVMFAPDQERAAAELLRVCRPGGRVGIASWTPEGFVGDFVRVSAKHLPTPPGLNPPLRWGTEAGLAQLLGAGATVRCERRVLFQHFASAEHALEVFRRYFGPTSATFEAVGPAGERALVADILEVFTRYNRATDGTLKVESAYLVAVATRK